MKSSQFIDIHIVPNHLLILRVRGTGLGLVRLVTKLLLRDQTAVFTLE